MAVAISTADLAPFAEIKPEKAQAMIEDAWSMAVLIAPCIDGDGFAHAGAVKAILRGAILRWNEAGAGGRTQVTDTVGPFSHAEAYQQPARRSMFWPSEIEQLKKLCAAGAGKAWSYDTAPPLTDVHDDVCSRTFGAEFCSCGADLAGKPLWGSDCGD